MKSKEEFVAEVKEVRAMLATDAHAGCSCPNTYCEYHGDCYNCVRIHLHFKDHVPRCFQPMLRDKMAELIQAVEYKVEDIPSSPKEYWDHLNQVAPKEPPEER